MPRKTAVSPKSEKNVQNAPGQTRTTLAPLGELITSTWEQTKYKFGTYAALFFLQILSFVLLVGIALLVGGVAGVAASLQGQNLQAMLESGNFLPLIAGLGGLMGLLVVITIVAVTWISAVFQGAMIAVAYHKDKLSVGDALRVGRSKAVPLFIANVVVGFLILGGLFVLVIPGIVFSILLALVSTAIVIDDVKGVEALRVSAGLVKRYFWEIFGRILVLMGINLAISFVLGMVLEIAERTLGGGTTGLVAFVLNMIINIGMMAFSVIYMTRIYQQVRAERQTAPMSLRLLAGISLFGYIIAGLLGWTVLRAAQSAVQNWPALMQEAGDQLEYDRTATDSGLLDELGSDAQLTEEEWQQLMRQALEEATASGKR